MTAARLVVTAATDRWARAAAAAATGYAASVIGCDAEAGIERPLSPDQTPDGRPGVSLLLFAFNRDALQKAVVNRVGQCILTCPTTACYNGLPVVKDKAVRVGGNLRFFGDGFQFSKKLEGRRCWRRPRRRWRRSAPCRASSCPSLAAWCAAAARSAAVTRSYGPAPTTPSAP